jgi:DNA replication licensing factor MCM4
MVIRCSNPLPEMREALFMCAVCLKTEVGELDRGRLEEPTLCTNCNTKHSFNMIHNRCQFTDRQIIKLQEAPGSLWTQNV